MARIRTIKPDFWEDDVIGALPPLARLMFVGTWNHADDEGIIRWTGDYLNAALFMYDGLSAKRVQELMADLVGRGLVFPYTANRTALAYIVHFRKHQRINRPQPSRFPAPGLSSEATIRMYGERDDWKCHLCGGPINQTREFTDVFARDRGGESDLNLSLDHLLPQSHGGSDYPSNIAAAHVACNKGRGNRPIEEFNVPRSVRDALSQSLNGSVNESMNGSPLEGNGREEERKVVQELPPEAPEYEDTKIPAGWSDLEAGLVKKLIEVDKVWAQLGPARINALNRDFGKPIVIAALQHMLEERNVPSEAYPMLRAVCMTIHTNAQAEVTSG